MRQILCYVAFLLLSGTSVVSVVASEDVAPRAACCVCCRAQRAVMPDDVTETIVNGEGIAQAPQQVSMDEAERCAEAALKYDRMSEWFLLQLREGIIVRLACCRACQAEEEKSRQRRIAAGENPNNTDDICDVCRECDKCYIVAILKMDKAVTWCASTFSSLCMPCRLRAAARALMKCCVCGTCCPVVTAGVVASDMVLIACGVCCLALRASS